MKLCLLAILLLAGCGRPTPPAQPTGKVRVVSLAPSLTEIICAIGAEDCLVGRSSACQYPVEIVKRVPVAGDFGAPSLETLVKLAPTVVMTVDTEDGNTGQAVRQLGMQYEHIACRTLDDIPSAIRRIGQLTKHEQPANELASKIETELAALRRAPKPANPPSVFVEVWGDPLMTAGKKAFLSELIALAGGRNVMDDVERDFFPVAPETVLARDPEVLILLEAKDPAAAQKTITQRAGWAQMSAVRTGRVCAGLDRGTLEVPGPRVLESVKILRECLNRDH
jgi:iron complex transport system substrate-binding protein